jgi:hypothetical protein
MRDYPRLDRSELTVTANTALGLFFRMKLRESGMHIIEESIGHENKDNGCMILSYLINHDGNITDIDFSRAKERWEQTLWNNTLNALQNARVYSEKAFWQDLT